MCKGITKKSNNQEKMLFSLPEIVSDRQIRVDFNASDISSNGGLLFVGGMKSSDVVWKISVMRFIPK